MQNVFLFNLICLVDLLILCIFCVFLQRVRDIVMSALTLYSADKTGMVDYALESAGGSVVSTRCSETFTPRTALFTIMGIPLWYYDRSPRSVIQVRIFILYVYQR